MSPIQLVLEDLLCVTKIYRKTYLCSQINKSTTGSISILINNNTKQWGKGPKRKSTLAFEKRESISGWKFSEGYLEEVVIVRYESDKYREMTRNGEGRASQANALVFPKCFRKSTYSISL